jgi:hypothetical protein
MPNFNAAKGTSYAEETQSRGGGRSSRLAPVKLEQGKRVFVRVLTRSDEVITADTHRFAPVTTQPTAKMKAKAKEAGKEVKWPDTMWGICPLDRIFSDGDGGYEDGYGECLIHTKYAGQKGGQYNKPLDKTDRHTYAVVVLQDVKFEGNNVVSCEDVIESWTDKDGTEHKVPAYRYLAQSWRNIWSAATTAAAMAEREDIGGQVFMLKRDGTDYTVLLVQSKKALPTDAKMEVYAKGLEMMEFSLENFILEHASAEHYDRFWGAGPQDKAEDGDDAEVDGAAGAVAEPDAAAGAEPDPEAQSRIDGFAAALAGQSKGAGAAEPDSAPESGEDAALVG